jgi:hypothetical protein
MGAMQQRRSKSFIEKRFWKSVSVVDDWSDWHCRVRLQRMRQRSRGNTCSNHERCRVLSGRLGGAAPSLPCDSCCLLGALQTAARSRDTHSHHSGGCFESGPGSRLTVHNVQRRAVANRDSCFAPASVQQAPLTAEPAPLRHGDSDCQDRARVPRHPSPMHCASFYARR